MITKISVFKKLLAQLMISNENDKLKLLDIINWIFYNHLTLSSL
jgi:hypothetical protein